MSQRDGKLYGPIQSLNLAVNIIHGKSKFDDAILTPSCCEFFSNFFLKTDFHQVIILYTFLIIRYTLEVSSAFFIINDSSRLS